MNEEEVVEATLKLESETTERLRSIERELEETSCVAKTVQSTLQENTSQLTTIQQSANELMESTKKTNKLLNKLRRWGAKSHVVSEKLSAGGTKTDSHTGTRKTGDQPGEKIDTLLASIDTDANLCEQELQQQRAKYRDFNRSIATSATAVEQAKKNKRTGTTNRSAGTTGNKSTETDANIFQSNIVRSEDDDTLDRIGDLLDGLQDKAKEYNEILNSHKKSLDKVDDTLDTAKHGAKQITRRLRT